MRPISAVGADDATDEAGAVEPFHFDVEGGALAGGAGVADDLLDGAVSVRWSRFRAVEVESASGVSGDAG